VCGTVLVKNLSDFFLFWFRVYLKIIRILTLISFFNERAQDSAYFIDKEEKNNRLTGKGYLQAH
jgi:hypothetical protein